MLLTYKQLCKLLKKWVAATGRDPERYTPHCLRGGGATHALNAGITGEEIKLMGDWATSGGSRISHRGGRGPRRGRGMDSRGGYVS